MNPKTSPLSDHVKDLVQKLTPTFKTHLDISEEELDELKLAWERDEDFLKKKSELATIQEWHQERWMEFGSLYMGLSRTVQDVGKRFKEEGETSPLSVIKAQADQAIIGVRKEIKTLLPAFYHNFHEVMGRFRSELEKGRFTEKQLIQGLEAVLEEVYCTTLDAGKALAVRLQDLDQATKALHEKPNWLSHTATKEDDLLNCSRIEIIHKVQALWTQFAEEHKEGGSEKAGWRIKMRFTEWCRFFIEVGSCEASESVKASESILASQSKLEWKQVERWMSSPLYQTLFETYDNSHQFQKDVEICRIYKMWKKKYEIMVTDQFSRLDKDLLAEVDSLAHHRFVPLNRRTRLAWDGVDSEDDD